MPLAIGQLLNDRYRIDALMGQGGMGAVYDAWDTRLGIRCAVKENLLFTEAAQRQFEREARMLATLRHAHLPRVSDHFVVLGQGQYLVMDFIEGDDLRRRLELTGPLPEAEVLKWGRQILEALAYLHHRSIIHRDIKPANIKVTPINDAVLVDFGISKQMDAAGGATVTGAQGLTPGFAPPEQYGAGRTGAYTDVYALGATLYVLLTGGLPADALSRMTKPEKFTPLSRHALKVSQPLAGVIDRALMMEPAERFANAGEMLAALDGHMPVTELGKSQRPTTSPPPPSNPSTTDARPSSASLPDRPVMRSGAAWRWGCWIAGGLFGMIVIVGLVIGGLIKANAIVAWFNPLTATPIATITPLPTRVVPPTAGPAHTATPSPAPTSIGGGGGMIAFASNRDHGGNLKEIYVMNANGSEQVALTDNPADNASPTWSADGTRIAFYSFREGNAEIYVMNADGSKVRNLTVNPGNDFDPVWSPDGNWIAFTSDRDGNREVYVMKADGSEVANLTNNSAKDGGATWSPDGTRIAFQSDRDGNQEIYSANRDGSDVVRLTSAPAFDGLASWSPDGRWILFVSDRDGNLELYQLNAALALNGDPNSEIIRLTNNPAKDWYAAWSPDGAQIAFTSDRAGNNQIYVLDVAAAIAGAGDAAVTRLTDNAAEDISPVWRP